MKWFVEQDLQWMIDRLRGRTTTTGGYPRSGYGILVQREANDTPDGGLELTMMLVV